MQFRPSSMPLIRFGVFEVHLRECELRKRGRKIRLQKQPFEVLATLLQRPGEVVTREELRQKLWPSDTFVDFNHGMNNAINRLREALCDSADKPIYIETLPRCGYRFIAPVIKEDQLALASCSQAAELSTVFSGIGSKGAAEGTNASPAAGAAETVAERTPSEVPASGEEFIPEPTRRLRRPAIPALVALVIGLVCLLGYWAHVRYGAAVSGPIRSVVVLPFQNLSGDIAQEYFVDGLTDELITEFAKIGSLRVISRTSSMSYKAGRESLAAIARELKVDAVVEGTVLRAGDRVRITAQLIRVSPEQHLWAKSYVRDLRDVLALQENIAHDITTEIGIKLTPREHAGLSSALPVDPEAHEAYLRGMYCWNQRTKLAMEKSIVYFTQATLKDSSYALAYAGLANAYNMLGIYTNSARRKVYPKAHAAALKALALDDTLAEAHAALGLYVSLYEWDQPRAEQEFRRAIELSPGYALAHVWHGEGLSFMERHAEALLELDLALQLDPTSLLVSDQRGWVLYMARRYDDAIQQMRKTIELEPRFGHAHCWLGKAYLQKGMLREGLAELMQAESLSGGDTPVFAPWVGYAYGLSGNRAAASKIIETMQAQEKSNLATPFAIAVVYCGLREKDQTLYWLERSYQARDPMLPGNTLEPAFDFLRSDPRFQDLVRRSNLPPQEQLPDNRSN